MSGGLTPCRQLRISSRKNMLVLQTVKCDGGKKKKKKKQDQSIMRKQSNMQTTHKSRYSAAAFKNSKISSGLMVLKRSCKEGT